MDQWVYWVGSRVAACMCCVLVSHGLTGMSSDSCRVSLFQVPPVCQCMRRVSPCGEGTVRVVSGLQPRWTSGAHDELAQKQRSLPCRLRSPVRVHLSCSQLLLTQLVLCGSAGKHTHTQTARQDVFILLRGPGVFAHQEKGRLWSELRPERIRGLHVSPGRLCKNKYNHVFANDVWFCLYEQQFIYMDAAFYSF